MNEKLLHPGSRSHSCKHAFSDGDVACTRMRSGLLGTAKPAIGPWYPSPKHANVVVVDVTVDEVTVVAVVVLTVPVVVVDDRVVDVSVVVVPVCVVVDVCVELVDVRVVVVDVTVVVVVNVPVTEVVVAVIVVVVVVDAVGVVVGVVISHVWKPSLVRNASTMFVSARAVWSHSTLSTMTSSKAHPTLRPTAPAPALGPANAYSTSRMADAVSLHVSTPVFVKSGQPMWYSHLTTSGCTLPEFRNRGCTVGSKAHLFKMVFKTAACWEQSKLPTM